VTDDIDKQGLFEGTSPEAQKALRSVSQLETIVGGQTLVRQGEAADTLYFVESGRFRVVIDGDRIVAHIEAGETVGELAFFAGGERTADVIAARDSKVLSVSRTDFDTVARKHAELNASLLKMVSGRLAVATARASSIAIDVPRVMAILPAGGSVLPEGFVDRLGAAMQSLLGGSLPFAVANEQKLGTAAKLPSWLAEEESKGGFLLVDASGSAEWSGLACRNVDSLIMVGRLDETKHHPNEAETGAMQWIEDDSRCFVSVRDHRTDEIAGTVPWLAHRNVKLHHHVALDDDADFAKLARFFTGRAVGLVLAGGGALGCAHLGIMEGLQKAHIPIDFIGGTSAGAAMGGAIARGRTVPQTLDEMEAMFIDAKAMRRITLPIYSLLDPLVFDHELKTRYGTKDIADQPVNFFGISTNLSTNDLHVHRRGPLWEAVRASGSLPTILPPFIDADQNILVDGGVLDNVPVRVMQQLKAGPNIVVMLGDPNKEWRKDVQYDQVRGRGQLLKDLILRRKPDPAHDFPNIFSVLERSMVVTSRMASKEMLSDDDILLNPPMIDGMAILDWQKGRALSDLASEYIIQQVAENEALAKIITK